jgi:hypothetical protein
LDKRRLDPRDLDLPGTFISPKGLLSMVTNVAVRILTNSEGARALLIRFSCVENADRWVADDIAADAIPVGMAMMDPPAIQAADARIRVCLFDVEALLSVEVDGIVAKCDHLGSQGLSAGSVRDHLPVCKKASERAEVMTAKARFVGDLTDHNVRFGTHPFYASDCETTLKKSATCCFVMVAKTGSKRSFVPHNVRVCDAHSISQSITAISGALATCSDLEMKRRRTAIFERERRSLRAPASGWNVGSASTISPMHTDTPRSVTQGAKRKAQDWRHDR